MNGTPTRSAVWLRSTSALGRSSLLGRPLMWGAIGAGCIALGGAVVGPAPLVVRDAFGRGVVQLPALGLTYVGVALLVTSWLGIGAEIRAGRPPSRSRLASTALAWGLPLAIGSPLFSRDVYSYAAQGQMVVRGSNPYRFGPGVLGSGTFLSAVSPTWLSTRAPYGPLFMGLDGFVVRHAANSLLAAVVGLRLLSLVGVLLIAVFLPRLAARHGVPASTALWLGLLNPLVLLHFVNGAHNDALMLGLLVAGVALASERRLAAGLVLCALATAVKAPAALGIVYVAFAYASPTRLRTIGWSALAAALTFAGLIVVAISRIVGLGWGWIGALRTPEQVKSYLSVTTAVGSILGGIAREIGGPSNSSWAISTMRMSGLLVALAIAAYLLAKRHDIGSYRALALTFLAGVACAPVIQPWYLTWGIVLLAATGVGRFEDIVVWISAVLALLISPRGSLAPAVVVVVLHALTIVLVVRSRLIPTFAVQWTSLAERWRQRGWPGIGEPYLTMSPSDQQP